MGGDSERIRQLERVVADLQRRLAGLPVRWTSSSPSTVPGTLLAKPTGTRAGEPGWYDGRLRTDEGTYPGADDCRIYDTEESLSNGHGLRLGQEMIVQDTGQFTGDTPPRKIVYTLGGAARTDSPISLPHGVGLTLNETEWNRDTSNGPVTWPGPRGVYDTTSHKYYVVTRAVTYDARGTLYAIGPEVAYEYVEGENGCP